ncbi:hypothetical protein [Clostridium sp. CF012]|uniref:hypothetical protein n=1 Tax=Clostridium sp. CF012 TaxID=2843319 RepID=UPI001C0D5882|nr:hypothetical protein [Clostridium sp. CF012]MBU3146087.1 hypothetical protein [Clostridium sp. CF012]
MKKKGNNGLYVENPTVGYQESQEQPTYDRKVEPYNKKEDPFYERKESYNTYKDSYDEQDGVYNEEEVDANDEESYYEEEEIYNEKAGTKVKQVRTYGNPLFVVGILYAFWPLGLYWMWKYKVYNKTARIVLSIVIPIFGTLRLIARFTD